MVIYLSLIFGVYFLFLLMCLAGWHKYARSQSHTTAFSGLVSVIVPVRNEETTLISLLRSLQFQDFPRERMQLIFVDDHSQDATVALLEKWCKENTRMATQIIIAVGEGKKNALTEGINAATGELILTTDADCQLPVDWITKMTGSFDESTNMVAGLVKIQPNDTLFSKLQAMEFASLMGAGFSFHAFGLPVMCNGASLACRKKCFEEVGGYEGNLNIASGDDEFLMRKIEKKYPGSISPIKNISVVTTAAQHTLSDFIQQRVRWAGKWKANDSLFAKSLAIVIFVFQLSCLVTWCLLLMGDNIIMYGLLLSLKIVLEGVFIFHVCKRTNQQFSMIAFFLLQLLYPVYVVLIALLSQYMGFQWKGRKMKSIG